MSLFGRRKQRWEENWAVYPGEAGGRLAMYFVDLGAVDAGPVGELPTRLDVSVRLAEPADSGLPDGAALRQVQDLEDRLIRLVGRKHDGVYVGRMLTAGTGRFTCYLRQPPGAPLPLETALPTEVTTAEDPAWEYLRDVLAPDEQQRHVIGDLVVVQALLNEGDHPDSPRPVEHVAYFAEPAAAGSAAAELRADGFEVTVERHDEGEYLLAAVRLDPVAPPDLHDLTWTVRGTVERHGGGYDGWSCPLVR
jgi:Regulator of ribonuclease activity B/Family of unknown function (DUF695)